MATEWFCALRGCTEGPLEAERILELRRRGALSDATLVWCEGMPEWKPLAEVSHLLTTTTTTTSTSPTTAAASTEYRVVELSPLSPYALEELLNRWAPEGWRLDQVVDGRLVVLRRDAP